MALAALGSLVLPWGPRAAWAFKDMAKKGGGGIEKGFAFAQLVYDGGNWDPEPTAWPSLAAELESTTSIDAVAARVPLRLRAEELFSYPFIYMAGNQDFQPFQDDQIAILRKYLSHGGTLVADDCAGTPGYGFDAAFRREIGRVFPEREMERLPSEHTVFRSFFLVRGMGGRKIVSPFLEGISLGETTPVIYSPNGLGAAWAKDSMGRWVHPTVPGGERQRKLAFQLGINLIMYALCSNYKQDRIHVPFLRQKI